MPHNTVRDYLAERMLHTQKLLAIAQKSDYDPDTILENVQDPDYRRYFDNLRYNPSNKTKLLALNKEYSTLVEAYRTDNTKRHQPYELHQSIPEGAAPIPES